MRQVHGTLPTVPQYECQVLVCLWAAWDWMATGSGWEDSWDEATACPRDPREDKALWIMDGRMHSSCYALFCLDVRLGSFLE